MIYASLSCRVAYIAIKKAGCTSILHNLLESDGIVLPDGDYSMYMHPHFRKIKPSQIKGFTVFTVVRNPYTRIVSSWRQKLQTGYAWALDEEAKMLQKDASLWEWVKFCTSKPPENTNGHWRPQSYVLTHKSLVPDMILKLESLDRTWESLSKGYGLPSLRHLNSSGHDLPKSFSQSSMYCIQSYYAEDFNYGYRLDPPHDGTS